MNPKIIVLESERELEDAVAARRKMALCSPPDTVKTWDNLLGVADLVDLDRDCAILDVGGRSGILPVWLGQLGFRKIWAIDVRYPFPPLRSAMRRAEYRTAIACAGHIARHWHRMRRGRAELLPFASESVSAVTCMSVIEHGVQLSNFLQEASRVLQPSGRLIMSTDFWYEPRALPEVGLFGPVDRIFTPNGVLSLFELARSAGFETPSLPPGPASGTPPLKTGDITYTFVYMSLPKRPKT